MEWLARNPCTHHQLINSGIATAVRDALRLGLPACLGSLSRVILALAQEGHGQADVLVHAGVGMRTAALGALCSQARSLGYSWAHIGVDSLYSFVI
jgi:hypothetical protein